MSTGISRRGRPSPNNRQPSALTPMMTLTTCPIAANGLERTADGYGVYDEGECVGRIWEGKNYPVKTRSWQWAIELPLPGLDYATGSASSFEEAGEQFLVAWREFRAEMGQTGWEQAKKIWREIECAEAMWAKIHGKK